MQALQLTTLASSNGAGAAEHVLCVGLHTRPVQGQGIRTLKPRHPKSEQVLKLRGTLRRESGNTGDSSVIGWSTSLHFHSVLEHPKKTQKRQKQQQSNHKVSP